MDTTHSPSESARLRRRAEWYRERLAAASPWERPFLEALAEHFERQASKSEGTQADHLAAQKP